MSAVCAAGTSNGGVKTIHLYDIEKMEDLLQGVFLASSEPVFSIEEQYKRINYADRQFKDQDSEHLPFTDFENLNISDKMICTTCEEPFVDREEQIQHYKSDWHRFNLKQKLRGEQYVSKDKFMEVTGEISSISGSETDSDTDSLRMNDTTEDPHEDEESYHIEGIGRRHPRVFLKNKSGELLSVYRCLLYGKKNQPETIDALVNLAIDLPKKLKWIVIMVAGGHFAAAVFDGKQIVAHKTFHRYVVRAKRGTAQSTHDNQGGHAKSVGAFMRRHHEAALYEDIKKLLVEWSDHLKSCDHIFLRAPGSNQKSLFGGKSSLLSRQDVRLHMVPFPTRRPTFNEVKRVHDMLATVYCYGTESKLTDHLSPAKTKKNYKQKVAQDTPKVSENNGNKDIEVLQDDQDSSDSEVEFVMNPETMDMNDLKQFDMIPKRRKRCKKKKKENQSKQDQQPEESVQNLDVENTVQEVNDIFGGLRNDIYTAVKVGNLDSMKTFILQLESSGADIPRLVNESMSVDGSRLLHIAARETHPAVVRFLLEMGADPSIRNEKSEFPYVMTKDKETRNSFRRFMADFPDKYNYSVAQIPAPLTSEMEEEKRAKEAEKRKLQKKAKKERLKTQKEEEAVKRKDSEEKHRFLNLSDRQKRALAAEKRFTSQLKDHGASQTPILSRCFCCGLDITGKIPFEYSDNIFCTTKCLKQHRLKGNS